MLDTRSLIKTLPALFATSVTLACSSAELEDGAVAREALTVSDGSVMTIVGVQAGNCLGVKGSSTASGALIQSQGCSGSPYQQWKAVRDGAGDYELQNVGSGKCLDVTGNSTAEGTNIQQWNCAGSDNQKWKLSDQGDGSFAILSKSSGLGLDVYEFSTANGARVVQWPFWGGENQRWALNGAQYDSGSTAPLADGSVVSFIGVRADNCLGVKGSSADSGATMQSQGCSGSNFQRWRATRDSAGYYQLQNLGSGKCLDVTGNSMTEGTDIQQWGCAGSDNQKWRLQKEADGSLGILSKSSGLALDVYARSLSNGARVVQWSYSGGDNQRWLADGSTGGGTTSAGVSGFASISSSGLSTTTGGGNATPTVVSSCSALKSALEDSTARVVQVAAGATLDCRTSGSIQACQLSCGSNDAGKVYWRVPVGDQTCADLGGGYLVSKQRSDFRVNVNSNKTLIGAGSGATLKGVNLNIAGKSNIIVRNLSLTDINPWLVEAGDALTIEDSHHVWVDHNRFDMISDGYFDIKRSSAVTVSNNHIQGRNAYVCGGQHHYISAVDASQVTFHHNFFDNTSGRNPKVTGSSSVHLYSNYYKNVSYFCLSAASGTAALVEGNYYENSRAPHWSEGGQIEANDNVYVGSSSSSTRDDNADVFTPPYAYSLDAPAQLASTLVNQVGPRSL